MGYDGIRLGYNGETLLLDNSGSTASYMICIMQILSLCPQYTSEVRIVKREEAFGERLPMDRQPDTPDTLKTCSC